MNTTKQRTTLSLPKKTHSENTSDRSIKYANPKTKDNVKKDVNKNKRYDTASTSAKKNFITQNKQPDYIKQNKPILRDDGLLRLSKLMADRGICSRREADDWIERGFVKVNGELSVVLGTRVNDDVVIEIDPKARSQQTQLVTILLNKPISYVSGQAEDNYEPAMVLIRPENRWINDPMAQGIQKIEFNRAHLRGLAPAGRLDIDSTGLLVFTQDGRIARALIGQDSEIEKEYLVRVTWLNKPNPTDGNMRDVVDPKIIAQLQHGLFLDEKKLKPAKVSWQNEGQLRFVLREGKKRQIRRMCELVGLKVIGLRRVRMGRIPLGNLPLGQWRYLAPWEKF
jgi:23S rRNA pseudouridine2604 synthase